MLWKWLPNLLTVLRLCAGLWLPFSSPFWWLPLVLFAAISDLVDGWLSRRWHSHSVFGQILDPVADKTFVVAALWVVWSQNWVSLLQLGWLSLRDLMVLGLTGCAAVSTRLTAGDLRPRWPGKVATAAQFCVLTALIYYRQPLPEVVMWGGLISAFAAADYAFAARSAWRRRVSAGER